MKKVQLSVVDDYSTLVYNYTDESGKVINDSNYDFGKTFLNGVAFVAKDGECDIIDESCKSIVKELKHSNIIKIALDNILAKDYFFLKNYKIGENLILSVDFRRLKKELQKYYPIKSKGGYTEFPWRDNYHWNESYQALFVINLVKDELCFSFIQDYILPSEGVIGIKPYAEYKEWIYISFEDFNQHEFDKPIFEIKTKESYQESSAGKNLLPPKIGRVEKIFSFKEGLAKIKVDGYFGFIDLKGNFVIPPIYDDARSFSEGFAAVGIANCRRPKGEKKLYKSDLRWNYIDKLNNKILSKSTELLTSIQNGVFFYCDSDNYIGKYIRTNIHDAKNGIIFSSNYANRSLTNLGRGVSTDSDWASIHGIGQLDSTYLCSLLNGYNFEELGFKSWVSHYIYHAYYTIRNIRCNLEISTLIIDFDTTQTELDFITSKNSLKEKYGDLYREWKKEEKLYISSDYDDLNQQGLNEMYDEDPDWGWNID